MRQEKWRKWVIGGLTVAAIVVYLFESQAPAPLTGGLPAAQRGAQDDTALVLQAFRDHRSGIWVETGGEVRNLLSDDNEGSRHQRFVLELDGGHTVLVAHNIDLADRVPLDAGDRITLRGMYEWNDRGGVIHWTHHDPKGRHSGGWIELDGETVR